ncbi:hypothetical protein HDU93_005967, partial [Gonapodya sp. JEL0774]
MLSTEPSSTDPTIIKNIRHTASIVGVGGFGVAVRATWRPGSALWGSSVEVVVKTLATASPSADSIREVKIWWNIPKHPNILPLYGVFYDGSKPCLVCKYASMGDMQRYLESRKLSDHEKYQLMLGTAQGLQHIHHHGVTHADLKPQNVLIDENGTPMVADFGFAKVRRAGNAEATMMSAGDKTRAGTAFYLPPERLREWLSYHANGGMQSPPSRSGDVYALAVIFSTIWNDGARPYSDYKGHNVYEDIIRNGERPKLSRQSSMPHDLRKLIVKSWDQDPTERPTPYDFVTCLKNLVVVEIQMLTPPHNDEAKRLYDKAMRGDA